MKFRYKKYGPNVLRPVIPVEIIHQDMSVPYEVLVDSGSDTNIFDAQLVDVLGLNLYDGKQAQVAGVTGVEEVVYVHKLSIKVGGHLFEKVEVGFLKQIGKFGYGIVGQRGFFDLFVVKFDLKKEEIELKPR
ncbi:aspartyl protease family protein [Candidatus Woesebacteria bacterium]|nr:aspartyl protease family protein [Candidatus Woesebacteria bacterium]